MKRQLISSVLALSLALGGAAALPEGVFTADNAIVAQAETVSGLNFDIDEKKMGK